MIRKIALPVALLALATTAQAATANTGPVGRWQLNEGGGSLATDSSGYGDNGTIVGGVSWTSGPSGSAVSFGGSGAVRVPDAPQLEPSDAVSVAAWVAGASNQGNYKYILAKGGHGCVSASYGLYSGPNGGLEFYISRGRGTTYARSPDAGTNVWDGRWHLAVGTFDGTTVRLYVDGTQVGSGTVYPGPIEYQLSDANDLFIGAYPSCTNENFDGTISDVRVWNRGLSPSDVSALLATDVPPPTGGSNPPTTAGPVGPTTGTPSGGGIAKSTPLPTLPVLHMVALSTSSITVGSGASGRRANAVITYDDSGSSRVTFTILQVQSNQAHSRCIMAARQHRRSAMGYCPRLVALGRFAHQDRPGRNSVRLPRNLTPAPGNYMLYVTPTLQGNVGKTVVIPFKVVAARHGR
jgi:hypothetical protein